jgi:hypothetical protein
MVIVKPHPHVMLMFQTCLIGLCAFGGWSFYQVIYALMSGQVRRFSHHAVSSSADSGYCMRAAEPRWFRYHISVYALQGILAFVLPFYVLFKSLL